MDRTELDQCEKELAEARRQYAMALSLAQVSRFPSFDHVNYMRDAAASAELAYSLHMKRERLVRELFCAERYGVKV